MGEFIVTESFGTAGEQGERQVVEALKAGLRKRACLGYWRYPLNSSLNNLKEPDILLLDPEWGIVIIEVKNIPLSQVRGIQGYSWRLTTPYFGKTEINPYEQARGQAQAIIERIRTHPRLASERRNACACRPGSAGKRRHRRCSARDHPHSRISVTAQTRRSHQKRAFQMWSTVAAGVV